MAVGAARILAVRTEELRDHSREVLDTADIESLHDMRVATRRLRAALEVFEVCFPKGRRRSALEAVKELADALGERRDRDVAIASLTEFGEGLDPATRLGVSSFVETQRAEQAEVNEKLRPHVAPERVDDLCDRLQELADLAAHR